MKALAFVLALLWAVSAQAAPEWASKPVQCSSIEEINQRQADEGLTPFMAGLTNARIEDQLYELPWVMFYDQGERGYYSVVEYNPEANYACQLLIGSGLDFDILDWFYKDAAPRNW